MRQLFYFNFCIGTKVDNFTQIISTLSLFKSTVSISFVALLSKQRNITFTNNSHESNMTINHSGLERAGKISKLGIKVKELN